MAKHKARRARLKEYTPRRTSKLPKEHAIQAAFIRALGEIPHPAAQGVCWYAVPNQAIGRSFARQAYFAAEGTVWGVADWHMFYPTKQFHGLYIEFKRPGEKLRENQQAFAKKVRACGHRVEVCFSADEGIAVVCDYLGLVL